MIWKWNFEEETYILEPKKIQITKTELTLDALNCRLNKGVPVQGHSASWQVS